MKTRRSGFTVTVMIIATALSKLLGMARVKNCIAHESTYIAASVSIAFSLSIFRATAR